MAKVHFFNPENDLALAAGTANYTPPKAALRVRKEGERLPLVYGDPGDKLLIDGINDWEGMEPCPWGWSAYAKRCFMQAGCPEQLLPSDQELEQLRQLSHRRTGAMIARRLLQMLPTAPLLPAATEATSIDEVRGALQSMENVFLKMPWSCSGRGVLDSRLTSEHQALQFAAHSIRRQGSVMVEKAHDKKIDFARLYECRHGECIALGTSVFTTDRHGKYQGNLIAPEAERQRALLLWVDLQLLQIIDNALRQILQEEIAPHYSGILGVDMLADSHSMIDAVVEMNLRHTMGYVALRAAMQQEPNVISGVGNNSVADECGV